MSRVPFRSIHRKSITPAVLEGRNDSSVESRGIAGQMSKHLFEIPLGTGAGKKFFFTFLRHEVLS